MIRLVEPPPSVEGVQAFGVMDDAEPALEVPGLTDNGGYDDFHRTLVTHVGAATGATRCGVLVWDDEAQLLRPIPGAVAFGSDEAPPAHDLNDWTSNAVRVFATGEPYLTNYATGETGGRRADVSALGLVRLMVVPLESKGQRMGVLQLADKPSDFTLGDLQGARRVASRLAVGARVEYVRERLLRRQQLAELLGQVAIDIASGMQPHDFLASAMDSVCTVLAGSMLAFVPTGADPFVRRRGPRLEPLENVVIHQSRSTTSQKVLAAGPRRAGDPWWAAAHLPVVLEGRQVGTVSALRTGGDPFDDFECRALARLAHLIALAWATERYQRHLADCARVEERQRIAEELHDQVAQLLFAARLSLDHAQEVPGLPDAARTSLQRARELISRADTATRGVMERHSRQDDEQLGDRLAAVVQAVEEEFGRPVSLDIAPDAAVATRALNRFAAGLLARAAREALVNAAKHAGPCRLGIRLTVTRRRRLLLTISDSGIGMGNRRGDGYGMAALRRAVRRHGGVLRVHPVSTGGTQVAVSLPL